MKTKIFLAVFFITGFFTLIYSQDNIQIGSSNTGRTAAAGAVYDYSDPSGVNIKVQLWGYVRAPGYYIIPLGLSVHELISFAGGPSEDALLDDIRVVKIREGSPTVMEKHNYNDLMWKDNIKNPVKFVRLEAGDIIVVPGEPRYFIREDVSFYLSIITALASFAALIISITN